MRPPASVDLAVMGAGMAGLSAAARASRLGLRVCVYEAAPDDGGASVIANGNLWTAPTLELLRAEDALGDPELGAALVDGFDDAVAWLRTMGQPCTEPTRSLNFGRGWQIDVRAYLRACFDAVIAAGGVVITGARVVGLRMERNAVTGVRVRYRGRVTATASRWTLLAGGGFQADTTLLRRHLGREADVLLLRSITHARGDGLRLAESAGAGHSRGMDRFYGHLVCAPSSRLSTEQFFALAQYQSDLGVLLNRRGARFTDESHGDHRNAEAVVRQPGAVAVLVFDDEANDAVQPPASVMGKVDKVATAAAAGGRAFVAGTLDEIAQSVAEWGYPRDRLAAELRDYNASLIDGGLAIGRSRNRLPVSKPPFRALEVRPAISFTKGGIRIDADARALTPNGRPVLGLLAAGNDAGGVFVDGYAGGLAAALVFGLRAAHMAGAVTV